MTISWAYLLISKRYLYYVAPRITPFLWITLLALFCWLITTIYISNYQTYRQAYRQSLLYSLLAIALLLAPIPDLSTFASPNPSNLSLSQKSSPTPPLSNSTPQGTPIPSTNAQLDDPLTDFDLHQSDFPLNGIDTKHHRIYLNEHNFYSMLLTLTNHLDRYEGYTLYMTGFVHRDDPTLAPNEYIIARLVMVCCIADLAPVGLTAYSEEEPPADGT